MATKAVFFILLEYVFYFFCQKQNGRENSCFDWIFFLLAVQVAAVGGFTVLLVLLVEDQLYLFTDLCCNLLNLNETSFTESQYSDGGRGAKLGPGAGRSRRQTKTGQSLWTVTPGEI